MACREALAQMRINHGMKGSFSTTVYIIGSIGKL